MTDELLAELSALDRRPVTLPVAFADDLERRILDALQHRPSSVRRHARSIAVAAVATALAVAAVARLTDRPDAAERLVTEPAPSPAVVDGVPTPDDSISPRIARPGGFAGDALVPTGDRPGAAPVQRRPAGGPVRRAAVPATAAGTTGSPGAPVDVIAFVRFLPGGSSIWTVRSDGTELRRVTTGAGNQLWPDWSPDGRRLVFITGSAAHIMDADGANVRRVSSPGRDEFDGFPAWSPDGRTIVLQRSVDTTVPNCYGATCSSELVLVDLESGRERRVGPGQYPSWSPDGTQLLFSVPRNDLCETTYAFSCHGALHVANADGSGRRALGPVGAFPRWSPDGRQVAYEAGQGVDGDVRIFDLASRSDRSVTQAVLDEGHPDWLPDGSGVVYAGSVDEHSGGILTVAVDGTGRRLIVNDGVLPTVRPR